MVRELEAVGLDEQVLVQLLDELVDLHDAFLSVNRVLPHRVVLHFVGIMDWKNRQVSDREVILLLNVDTTTSRPAPEEIGDLDTRVLRLRFDPIRSNLTCLHTDGSFELKVRQKQSICLVLSQASVGG